MVTKVSLCVLTRNRTHLYDELLRSFKRNFPESNLEVEVCIADNSATAEHKQYYQDAADFYAPVTDEELWYEGFSYAKNKAIRLASNPWVVVADLGEVWVDNLRLQLGKAIQTLGGDCPAFRAQIRAGGPDLCRIFDKRRMRLMGMIHEMPYARRSPTIWSHFARRHPPVAYIQHAGGDDVGGPDFAVRKEALYDHLLETIYHKSELRPGTDPAWYDKYWPKRVAEGVKTISFEEWQGMPG